MLVAMRDPDKAIAHIPMTLRRAVSLRALRYSFHRVMLIGRMMKNEG
jgi:hypothetical protein